MFRRLPAYTQQSDGGVPCCGQRYHCRPEISATTQALCRVPVSDLDASVDWYTRFFRRPPDLRAGDEVLWDIDAHATLFIEPNAAHAAQRVILHELPDRSVRPLEAAQVEITHPIPDGIKSWVCFRLLQEFLEEPLALSRVF